MRCKMTSFFYLVQPHATAEASHMKSSPFSFLLHVCWPSSGGVRRALNTQASQVLPLEGKVKCGLCRAFELSRLEMVAAFLILV